MLLVTGGAGFIGGHFVYEWLKQHDEPIVMLDALTYAASPQLMSSHDATRLVAIHGDIRDRALLMTLLERYQPRAIVHFAAETHVDCSIADPDIFIDTNINGSFTLLEATRHYWQALPGPDRAVFRFVQVSSDEVYGSLADAAPAFTETSPYQPNNPYAASKAASDHLARAWHQTYGLPVLTTHCSNNYGPRQFPEKLLPHMIDCALRAHPMTLYGDGQQRRDWLYVSDHCNALRLILQAGIPGETYNVGSGHDITNLELMTLLCEQLDKLQPDPAGAYARLIRFGTDRLGHDQRYAINSQYLRDRLGWQAQESLSSGLAKTVAWYLAQTTGVGRGSVEPSF